MSNLSAVLYGPSDLRMVRHLIVSYRFINVMKQKFEQEKLTIPCPGDHGCLAYLR